MNSGFMNDTASVAGSRKSMSIHPVLMVHPGQDDTYSQFSQRTVPRSVHSGHYAIRTLYIEISSCNLNSCVPIYI
nr:unnamed protein product [Callosobruchus analis]